MAWHCPLMAVHTTHTRDEQCCSFLEASKFSQSDQKRTIARNEYKSVLHHTTHNISIGKAVAVAPSATASATATSINRRNCTFVIVRHLYSGYKETVSIEEKQSKKYILTWKFQYNTTHTHIDIDIY